MRLDEVMVDGYRNLKGIHCIPHPKMNVICGENAQGKTNLIESILLCTGFLRETKENVGERIGFHRTSAELTMRFWDQERENLAKVTLGEGSRILLNRVEKKNLSSLCGIFLAVCLTPAQMNWMKGSPKERRRLIDEGIVQVQTVYRRYLREYERVVRQRNALLKIRGAPGWEEQLDIWDWKLARSAVILSIIRWDYIQKLSRYALPIYREISSGRESLKLRYSSPALVQLQDAILTAEKVNAYYQEIIRKREEDLRFGFSTVGAHRDDLEVGVNNLSLKQYGSQGQVRSAMLAIRLGQARLIRDLLGQSPIVLLDDVMSELDASRQRYLLNRLEDCQVFISGCEKPNEFQMQEGKIFEMKRGELTELLCSVQEG